MFSCLEGTSQPGDYRKISDRAWSAATGKDAAVKTEVINALFGTHSWTAVEKIDPDVLEDGAEFRAYEEPGHLADASRPRGAAAAGEAGAVRDSR